MDIDLRFFCQLLSICSEYFFHVPFWLIPPSLPPPSLPPSLPLPSLPPSPFPPSLSSPLSQTTRDGDRLLEDLKHSLMRNTGFDAVMRVRASTGTLEKLTHLHFILYMYSRLSCLSDVTSISLFSSLMVSAYPTCFVSPSLFFLLPLFLSFLTLSPSLPPPSSSLSSSPSSLTQLSLPPCSLSFSLSNSTLFLLPHFLPLSFPSLPPSSPGLRPTGFYGAFFMSNTTDIELGNIDADKAIAVEIKHDDKLKEDDIAFFQVSGILCKSCDFQYLVLS